MNEKDYERIINKYLLMFEIGIHDPEFSGRDSWSMQTKTEELKEKSQEIMRKKDEWELSDLITALHEEARQMPGFKWQDYRELDEEVNEKQAKWYLTLKEVKEKGIIWNLRVKDVQKRLRELTSKTFYLTAIRDKVYSGGLKGIFQKAVSDTIGRPKEIIEEIGVSDIVPGLYFVDYYSNKKEDEKVIERMKEARHSQNIYAIALNTIFAVRRGNPNFQDDKKGDWKITQESIDRLNKGVKQAIALKEFESALKQDEETSKLPYRENWTYKISQPLAYILETKHGIRIPADVMTEKLEFQELLPNDLFDYLYQFREDEEIEEIFH